MPLCSLEELKAYNRSEVKEVPNREEKDWQGHVQCVQDKVPLFGVE